jgi:hypothetical protein
VENRLSELWSIMEFTNPGLLGPAEKFREKYAIPIERHGSDEAPPGAARITQPFVLRRLKTDKTIISDLPDKQEMKVWCNLTPEQASLYAATVTDMLKDRGGADDISRRGLVLATMAKLKQVCNHPAHLLGDGSRLPGRSGKLARLEEICDEIVAEGDKALCFTQYAEFGRMLQPHLAARLGCPVLFLHGGTTKKQRDAMVARSRRLDEPRCSCLSLKAGGTGLNLTAANHVIHVDRWWNPAVEDQATDRAFRIGQRKRRPGAQVRLRRHPGGADRRDDRGEEGAGRADRRHRRELAHRAVRRRPALGARPVARRGVAMSGGYVEHGEDWRDWPERPGRSGSRAASRPRASAARSASSGGRGGSSRARVLRHERPAGPGPQLRPGRAGARLRALPGQGHGPVQGSRVRPYQVRIGVLPLTTAQWRGSRTRLASQALFRAKLLAGEMPHEIEEVFADCGTPLFPRSAATWRCGAAARTGRCRASTWPRSATCWPRRSTRDPFGLLAWRGKGRDDLLASLRPDRRRAGRAPAGYLRAEYDDLGA